MMYFREKLYIVTKYYSLKPQLLSLDLNFGSLTIKSLLFYSTQFKFPKLIVFCFIIKFFLIPLRADFKYSSSIMLYSCAYVNSFVLWFLLSK